jgi:hypothetical protein
MSIQAASASSGGTIASHSMTMLVSFHGLSLLVRVVCQWPLLSHIHSTGRGLTPHNPPRRCRVPCVAAGGGERRGGDPGSLDLRHESGVALVEHPAQSQPVQLRARW